MLNTGTWAAVPESKKQLLSLNTSMAVKLAAVEVAWYSPIPAFRLITAMGSSVDVPLPQGIQVPLDHPGSLEEE